MDTKEMREILKGLDERLGDVSLSEKERGQVIRAGLKGWRYPAARVLAILRTQLG